MGFFNFLTPETKKFNVPENMDITVAVRRILQILNDTFPSETAGSTTSVGNSFKTVANLTIDDTTKAKQFQGVPSPRGVLVMARSTNQGAIYVGDADVTNALGTKCGIQLTPAGMTSVVLPVDNSNRVYVAADTANDKAYCVVL